MHSRTSMNLASKAVCGSIVLMLCACGSSSSTPGDDSQSSNDAATPASGDDASSPAGYDAGTGDATALADGAAPADGAGTGDAAIPVGAPAAPTDLQMTHQGQDDVVLTWAASVAGAHPVASYRIYRNGVAYDTTTTTTYTDTKATNVTTPGYGPQPYLPATVYRYTVSAVDADGVEGAQQTQCTAWVYRGGVDFWTTSTNNYSGGVTFITNDTTGKPQYGAPTDIALTTTAASNYWQPFSGAPFLHDMAPTTWAMEIGMFGYLTIDLEPTMAGQTWRLDVISRVSPGDNYNSAGVVLGGADATFGPEAQVGKWATYKIPFLDSAGFADGTSLQVGFGKFQASIAGTTMTVTKLLSGINVQGSSYLSGTGVEAGSASSTATYVASSESTEGMEGTYTIAPSQTVASTTVTTQRTNMYKLGLQDLTSVVGNKYYVDNLGFTTQ